MADNKPGRKDKPLYAKKFAYLGIKGVRARPNPHQVTTMEAYYPFRGEGNLTGLASLARVKHKRSSIAIKTAATHEVVLTRDTVSDSIETIGDPEVRIAVRFTIYGSTRTLLNNRRSGTAVFFTEHKGEDKFFFVLNWKDALDDPLDEPKTEWGTHEWVKRRLQRSRYPVHQFCREEQGRKVYYVQEASPQELTALTQVLSSVRDIK